MPEFLIHPIQLGNVQFQSNLIQAPLAGISCAPFRDAIMRFGGAAYCTTEMISAKTLLHCPPKRYIHKSATEGPLCFQLSGNNQEELQKAALLAMDYGANLIDLNCGCPVDKIRKKGGGSRLLAESQKLRGIVKAIKNAVEVPVSVKIRVDAKSGDHFNTDVVEAAQDAGADFIIVHGRHWNEHYETSVHLDEIAAIVNASKIPIIGNGDVRDYASLKQMFYVTGCAGIMIGRAPVGQPWLFAKLQAEDRSESYIVPAKREIGALFLNHIQGLIALENEALAVLQARKLSKYYLRAARLPEALQLQFNQAVRFDEVSSLVSRLFIS